MKVISGSASPRIFSKEKALAVYQEMVKRNHPIDGSWHDWRSGQPPVLTICPAGISARIDIEFESMAELHKFAVDLPYTTGDEVEILGTTDLYHFMIGFGKYAEAKGD